MLNGGEAVIGGTSIAKEPATEGGVSVADNASERHASWLGTCSGRVARPGGIAAVEIGGGYTMGTSFPLAHV